MTAAPLDSPAVCTGHDGGHDPDEPLVVRWWRDRWWFAVVVLDVVDAAGRSWATGALGSVEVGSFPVVDPATGEVTVRQLDPLTDPDHPLPDLIDEVLEQAQRALVAHAAAGPVIEQRRS